MTVGDAHPGRNGPFCRSVTDEPFTSWSSSLTKRSEGFVRIPWTVRSHPSSSPPTLLQHHQKQADTKQQTRGGPWSTQGHVEIRAESQQQGKASQCAKQQRPRILLWNIRLDEHADEHEQRGKGRAQQQPPRCGHQRAVSAHGDKERGRGKTEQNGRITKSVNTMHAAILCRNTGRVDPVSPLRHKTHENRHRPCGGI